jgi:phosphoribosylamine--glycine ligase
MDVLIVGGGGREHALAWHMARSASTTNVYVAPGNAGTQRESGVQNVAIGAEDITALLDFARHAGIGLTVVGPEGPLVAGIVDAFERAGLPCLGPTCRAAELEGSKAYAKDFLARHGIPTARYASFDVIEEAQAYLRSAGAPVVVKADGLAAGKGVTVAQTLDEAMVAVESMLSGETLGGAGDRIVIEECLTGEEISYIALVDGEAVVPLASSQDHKPRDDGDGGPNTGGMGAYSPAPLVTEALEERILEEIIRPAVAGLAADGRPFRGFLYAGLMVGADGTPRVLEFNVRLGDPEAEPVLMRLRSDLAELCLDATQGRLGDRRIEWDPRPSLGVVMAAAGYPGRYNKGDVILGLPDVELTDRKVFHAGTALDSHGQVVTAGGRVLCVCAIGDSVQKAQVQAYDLVDNIGWQGAFCRRDIGHRAVERGY